MTINLLDLLFVILAVVMVGQVFYSYGQMQYYKGRRDMAKEALELTEKAIAEHNERVDAKKKKEAKK